MYVSIAGNVVKALWELVPPGELFIIWKESGRDENGLIKIFVKERCTAKQINFGKEIWEGWTVGNFIDSLDISLKVVMTGKSWHKPFTTKSDLRDWCINNQPYYKREIPEVVDYFAEKYGLN